MLLSTPIEIWYWYDYWPSNCNKSHHSGHPTRIGNRPTSEGQIVGYLVGHNRPTHDAAIEYAPTRPRWPARTIHKKKKNESNIMSPWRRGLPTTNTISATSTKHQITLSKLRQTLLLTPPSTPHASGVGPSLTSIRRGHTTWQNRRKLLPLLPPNATATNWTHGKLPWTPDWSIKIGRDVP